MEKNKFNEIWSKLSSEQNLEEKIEECSKIFKVSEEVVARRLLDQEFINNDKYEELRAFYKERYKEIKKREKINKKGKGKESFPSPNLLKVLSNGKLFARTILSAYFNGNISGSDTSNYLNAKINNFNKLIKYAGLDYGQTIK